MTKEELKELLDSLAIKVNEGIQSDTNTNEYPRLVYWEYVWNPQVASGQEYNTSITYQLSFFSQVSRDPKLILLKQKLKEKGINPIIYHEYIQEGKYFHSYLAVEVLENV
jgi:hypothetical protein